MHTRRRRQSVVRRATVRVDQRLLPPSCTLLDTAAPQKKADDEVKKPEEKVSIEPESLVSSSRGALYGDDPVPSVVMPFEGTDNPLVDMPELMGEVPLRISAKERLGGVRQQKRLNKHDAR